jgi:hypothetical protein
LVNIILVHDLSKKDSLSNVVNNFKRHITGQGKYMVLGIKKGNQTNNHIALNNETSEVNCVALIESLVIFYIFQYELNGFPSIKKEVDLSEKDILKEYLESIITLRKDAFFNNLENLCLH